MNEALQIPGLTNAWTMPIKGRIDMLTHRHPHAGRAQDLRRRPRRRSRRSATQIEALLPAVPGTRSVFAERTGRRLLPRLRAGTATSSARYGLSVDEAQDGGRRRPSAARTSTTTVEGRERYPVNVRYMRDFRSDLEAARPGAGAGRRRAAPDPARAARRRSDGRPGPSMIRNEDGLLTGYVYVDIAGRDLGELHRGGRRGCSREKVTLPPGYAVAWSGQYEAMQRVARAAEGRRARSRSS
ncbi:MAG: hypothetical protein M0C28_01515 [Candidatus Moduliflexus flocculans]|nr:hypothetical protein [Candidatus Moduliflexus flocculans]